MMWQHIEFIDGSNPYICKTEKEFERMKRMYVLENITDNLWKATYRIYYKVVGFTYKDKKATFDRDYKTENGAMNFIRKAIKEEKFECIVLRKETSYLKNNEHLEISSSVPIRKWEF